MIYIYKKKTERQPQNDRDVRIRTNVFDLTFISQGDLQSIYAHTNSASRRLEVQAAVHHLGPIITKISKTNITACLSNEI